MERVISDEEKIRRAIQISQRRNQNDYAARTAKLSIQPKKNYKLFKKMILQILICLCIYFIFYLITTTNYVFSDQVIKTTTSILNYDINLQKLYKDCENFVISTFHRNEESQEDNLTNMMMNSSENVGEINSEEENTIINQVTEEKKEDNNNQTVNQEKSAMELDAEKVKKFCSNIDVNSLAIEDKWILSKLNKLIADITRNIERYDFGVAIDKLYGFIWNEFCDWYIEIVKPRLYNKESETRRTAQYVLNKVLSDSLKLLHPFMPFVTERIYKELYNNDESIMIAQYPEYNKELEFKDEEEKVEELKEIITGIRNVRATMNVHPSKKSKLIFVTKNYEKVIKESEEFLKKLGFSDEIKVQETKENIPQNAINVVAKGLEVFMPFEDLVDIKEEIERLEKEKAKVLIEKEKTDKMLSNPGFIAKAPASKVEEEKEKQAKFNEIIASIDERIKGLN